MFREARSETPCHAGPGRVHVRVHPEPPSEPVRASSAEPLQHLADQIRTRTAKALDGRVRCGGEQDVGLVPEHREQLVHRGRGLLQIVDDDELDPLPLGPGKLFDRVRRGEPGRFLRREQPHRGGDQPGRVERLGHAQIETVAVVLQQHGGRLPLRPTVLAAQSL